MEIELSVTAIPVMNIVAGSFFPSFEIGVDTKHSLADSFMKLRVYKQNLSILDKIKACIGVCKIFARVMRMARLVGGVVKC